MNTPETQQIFDTLCKSIANGEWAKDGYLRYRRKIDRVILDGSGSPIRWTLQYENKRFKGFGFLQNRKITRMLRRLEQINKRVQDAEHAKVILNQLDPEAESKAATKEIKTWIET